MERVQLRTQHPSCVALGEPISFALGETWVPSFFCTLVFSSITCSLGVLMGIKQDHVHTMSYSAARNRESCQQMKAFIFTNSPFSLDFSMIEPT